MSVTEPRWLDRLALRAARRDPERGYAPIRVVDGGVSRRTVVRATGAAVVLGGVARFLVRPPAARADAFGSFEECRDYNYKLNDYIYDQCAKGPTATWQAADAAITKARAALKTAKTKGQKARQKSIILQNQVTQAKAIDALLDCGFQYAHDRSRSFADCRAFHPPSGGGGARRRWRWRWGRRQQQWLRGGDAPVHEGPGRHHVLLRHRHVLRVWRRPLLHLPRLSLLPLSPSVRGSRA